MKNLLLVVALLFSLPACAQISGFPQSPRFKDVSLTGSLTSTKACATNYTRAGPNFCQASPAVSTAWTNQLACTQRTFTNALPAGAKAVYLQINWLVSANNGLLYRSGATSFFRDTGCTVLGGQSNVGVMEFVATAAGTTIAQYTGHVIAPLSGTNQISNTQTTTGVNGQGNINSVLVLGYFD
jgi:hypothetical protein